MKLWMIIGAVVLASIALLIAFNLTGPGSGQQASQPAPSSTQHQPQKTQTSPPATQKPETPKEQPEKPGKTEEPQPPAEKPAEKPATPSTPPSKLSTKGVKNPDTLIIADAGNVAVTLDPAFAYDTSSGFQLYNIYENLIKYQGVSTTEFAPLLATQVPSTQNGLISQNPDGSETITFPLRSGVKFQNGDPLTPEDAAYSFQRLLLLDRSGGPSWLLIKPLFGVNAIEDHAVQLEAKASGQTPQQIRAAAKKAGEPVLKTLSSKTVLRVCRDVQQAVQVKGDQVVFHLPQPFPPFLAILAHGASWSSIIDKKWTTAQGGWDGNCADWLKYHDPVKVKDPLYDVTNGTGPFKLEKWDHTTQQIWLLRNDNYWRGPAKLKRVIDKSAGEWSTRQLMLDNGDADLAVVPRQFVDQIDGTPGIRLVKGQTEFVLDYIFFNQKIRPEGNPYIGSGKLDGQGIPPDFFADLNVRAGFEYSFDWKIYIKEALKGEAEKPTGPIPLGVPYFNPENPTYHLDLQQAKAHFQKAFGGKLWKVGFKLNFVCVSPCEGAYKTAFEILRRNLQKVNPKFKLGVTPVQWSTFLGQSVQSIPPLFGSGWQEDYHDPHNWVFPVMSSQGTYSEYLGIGTRYDKLIQAGITTLNKAKRQEIYNKLQKLAYDDAIAIFLDQPLGRHYERTWVGGYYYNALHPLDLYALYKATKAQPNMKLIEQAHLTVKQW